MLDEIDVVRPEEVQIGSNSWVIVSRPHKRRTDEQIHESIDEYRRVKDLVCCSLTKDQYQAAIDMANWELSFRAKWRGRGNEGVPMGEDAAAMIREMHRPAVMED